MFNIQRLSDKIDELFAARLDVDSFEDWFVAESWGHYEIQGHPLSQAIAAVHHVLHRYERDEVEERQVAEELAMAIRPFALSPIVFDEDGFLAKIALQSSKTPPPVDESTGSSQYVADSANRWFEPELVEVGA
ncbi:MAG TPA: hypothetical protein VFL57_22075 [Bryobacteraceae bacterium]|nr:hypothetical protein [Bryobacteraceae bacterium]